LVRFSFPLFSEKMRLAPRHGNRNFVLKTIWSSSFFFFFFSFSFLSFPPPPAHPNQSHQSTNPGGKYGWTVAPTPKRDNNSQIKTEWWLLTYEN
jgi:hypothetical protein